MGSMREFVNGLAGRAEDGLAELRKAFEALPEEEKRINSGPRRRQPLRPA
jgi:hypothetical protein